jgi:hypothetical protein
MSADPYSRRFDPCRLFPAIGKDGAALFGALDTTARFDAEESADDLAGCPVDLALEQFDMEGCRVCPLCGAIVARDGSVLG